jgi:hypothetical protein
LVEKIRNNKTRSSQDSTVVPSASTPFHPAFIEIIQDNVSIGDSVSISKISASNEPTIMIIVLALLSIGIGIFSYLIIRSLREKSRT